MRTGLENLQKWLTDNRRPPVTVAATAEDRQSTSLFQTSPQRTARSPVGVRALQLPGDPVVGLASLTGCQPNTVAGRNKLRPTMITASRSQNRAGSFTLVELLAVVVVICILMGSLIAIAKYANLKIQVARAKAQMVALQMALESYKADVGCYPVSTWVRYSGYGSSELSNSACLYRALTQPKRYYPARMADIGASQGLTYFKDPWGTAWNYYRPTLPQPTSLIVCNVPGTWFTIPQGWNAYAYGGQHNPQTYDLSSFGPDKITTIPGAAGDGYTWIHAHIGNAGHELDDIVNWTR